MQGLFKENTHTYPFFLPKSNSSGSHLWETINNKGEKDPGEPFFCHTKIEMANLFFISLAHETVFIT